MFFCQNMNWKMIEPLKENKPLQAFLSENISAIPHIQLIRDPYDVSHYLLKFGYF